MESGRWGRRATDPRVSHRHCKPWVRRDQHNHRVQKFSSPMAGNPQWGEAVHTRAVNLPGLDVDAQGGICGTGATTASKNFSRGAFVASLRVRQARASQSAVGRPLAEGTCMWRLGMSATGSGARREIPVAAAGAPPCRRAEAFFAPTRRGQTRAVSNITPKCLLTQDTTTSLLRTAYLGGPVSVKLDRENRLYVPETNRHRVQIYQKT